MYLYQRIQADIIETFDSVWRTGELSKLLDVVLPWNILQVLDVSEASPFWMQRKQKKTA